MNTITGPIPEVTEFFPDPEPTAVRAPNPEPNAHPALGDAEEEEIAQLWAADPGNQGA